LNYYEGMYILDASLSDERLQELIDSVKGELGEKGEVLAIDHLGRKQLAHSVGGQTEGEYIVIYFANDPAEIARLQSKYSLNASILRVMILRRKEEEIRVAKEKLGHRTAEAAEPPTKPEPAEAPAPEPVVAEDFGEPVEEAPGEDVIGPTEEAFLDENSATSEAETEKTE